MLRCDVDAPAWFPAPSVEPSAAVPATAFAEPDGHPFRILVAQPELRPQHQRILPTSGWRRALDRIGAGLGLGPSTHARAARNRDPACDWVSGRIGWVPRGHVPPNSPRAPRASPMPVQHVSRIRTRDVDSELDRAKDAVGEHQFADRSVDAVRLVAPRNGHVRFHPASFRKAATAPSGRIGLRSCTLMPTSTGRPSPGCKSSMRWSFRAATASFTTTTPSQERGRLQTISSRTSRRPQGRDPTRATLLCSSRRTPNKVRRPAFLPRQVNFRSSARAEGAAGKPRSTSVREPGLADR